MRCCKCGSFIEMDSKKIQAHCPDFIEWCRNERKKDQDNYIRQYRDKLNNGILRRIFRFIKLYDLGNTENKIICEKNYGSIWQGMKHSFNYPSYHLLVNERAAKRLMAMSKKSSKVFVGNDDFDLVFRTGYKVN